MPKVSKSYLPSNCARVRTTAPTHAFVLAWACFAPPTPAQLLLLCLALAGAAPFALHRPRWRSTACFASRSLAQHRLLAPLALPRARWRSPACLHRLLCLALAGAALLACTACFASRSLAQHRLLCLAPTGFTKRSPLLLPSEESKTGSLYDAVDREGGVLCISHKFVPDSFAPSEMCAVRYAPT